jgi:VCBS repeat-containing protein
VAVNDATSVTEDGTNPVSGNVLTNDTDADGDSMSVSRVEGVGGNVGSTLNGNYGTVRINSNGTYRYTLNNSHPAVNALNAGQTLTESFDYTVTDGSVGSNGRLTITINGSTDVVNTPPTAVADTNSVTEDSVANPVIGTVLSNDSDGDGDPLTVDQVNGLASNVGNNVTGNYGTLVLRANGSYDYTLDNSNAMVNALGSGQTLTENFLYRITDSEATASSSLTLTIRGADDNGTPVAVADSTSITEDSNTNPVSGNVLSNDSDPDGDTLTVVRVNGIHANVGRSVAGSYGSLLLRADGSFDYTLNNANPTVNALNDGQTLTDTFIYQSSDTQLLGNATLAVTIRGATDEAAPAGTDLLARSGDMLLAGVSTGTSFTRQNVGSWSGSVNWSDLGTGDVNGDGVDDLIGRAPNGDWWVGIGNENGFDNAKWGQWSNKTKWDNVRLADVTGDGRTDIVGRTGGVWWVARSTDSGFVNERWGQWSTKVNWQYVMMADVNGDGRSDIVGRISQNGSWWAAISTGTQFDNQYMGRWAKRLRWTDVRMADVDGDGKDDLLGRAGATWWVGRSTGTEFVNEKWGAWSARARWEDVRIADVDGDGRDDVIGRTSGDWWVARSNGQRFVNERWGNWSTSVDWLHVRVADFDGDGKDDILGYVKGKWWVARSDSDRFVNELWANWSDNPSDVLTGEFPNGITS